MINNNLFLSFGGGVQTTALLLAYDRGLLKEKPKIAIFADTQAETKEIYDWIEYLKTKTSIPIRTATRGSIIEYTKRYNYTQAPVFGLKENGVKYDAVLGRRSCTYLFKISVVNREIRKITNTKGKRLKEKAFRVSLGISTDEEGRVSKSQEKWIENIYPLCYGLKWNRNDCIEFVKEELGKTPPRSACYMCPYLTNKEWKALRDNNPKEWKKAVEYDDFIRDLKPGIKNFLHRDRVPLKEAHIDNEEFQADFFKQTCFGDCGL